MLEPETRQDAEVQTAAASCTLLTDTPRSRRFETTSVRFVAPMTQQGRTFTMPSATWRAEQIRGVGATCLARSAPRCRSAAISSAKPSPCGTDFAQNGSFVIDASINRSHAARAARRHARAGRSPPRRWLGVEGRRHVHLFATRSCSARTGAARPCSSRTPAGPGRADLRQRAGMEADEEAAVDRADRAQPRRVAGGCQRPPSSGGAAA